MWHKILQLLLKYFYTHRLVCDGGCRSVEQLQTREGEDRRLPLSISRVELCVPSLYLSQFQVSGLGNGLGRATRPETTIRDRCIELTQSQPDTSIDETKLYLSVVERDDKGQTYGLGRTSSGSRRRHAGAGAGAGSSRPISANNELIEQPRGTLWRYRENSDGISDGLPSLFKSTWLPVNYEKKNQRIISARERNLVDLEKELIKLDPSTSQGKGKLSEYKDV
ncbi:hypothetical protein Scep_025567 [Stephania cephalantha]|uniref:Uncharacterized protein n=1 Tax=Stephania cephalantha TaxID=152367 RepID=A0AAP0EP24_9MAGN